jgi:hypothetical protein
MVAHVGYDKKLIDTLNHKLAFFHAMNVHIRI